MEKKFMRELYTRTVSARNIKPNDDELEDWNKVLDGETYSDVDAALRRWTADINIEEFTGRPRGARMPKAAEIKLSIVEFNKVQTRTSFRGCGKNGCVNGWVPLPEIGKKLTHRVTRCECFKEYAMARQA